MVSAGAGQRKPNLAKRLRRRLNKWKRLLLRRAVARLVLRPGLVPEFFGARDLNAYGLSVTLVSDYFSPLPVVARLEETKDRWFQPSKLEGISIHVQPMKDLLTSLVASFDRGYQSLPSYEENRGKCFGLGFPPLDAMLLYLMIRDLKPKRYVEVGSGLSTYYCWLAAQENARSGFPLRMSCIDPYAYGALHSLQGVEIVQQEVQDVDVSFFGQLEAGDVLLIDSTHVVRIDGDVPYLYLEVLPRLKQGVVVHIHDVPFPYNVPYPPDVWVLGPRWPYYWNEAMLLQAFLCRNEDFDILLSLPYLRYHDEDFLRQAIPNYAAMTRNPAETFSSIWIRKVGRARP